MSKDELILKVVQSIPYPGQIKELDSESRENTIQFQWRGHVFRVSVSLHVDEVQGDLLVGSSAALLLQALLGNKW